MSAPGLVISPAVKKNKQENDCGKTENKKEESTHKSSHEKVTRIELKNLVQLLVCSGSG